jgi:hypothetical protein
MKELSIGRSRECQILIDDISVSRRHATLIISEGTYQIIDNNSTNGTYVNGSKIHGSRSLQHNDILKVGNVIIPWRNYINESNSSNMERGGTKPLPIQAPPPMMKPQKNNHTTTIIISLVIVAFIVGGGIFYFKKQNSDSKKIIGKWRCIDNCGEITEIIFDDDHKENTVEYKLDGVEAIRVKGKWRIIESRKRLVITIKSCAEDNENDEEKYDYFFRDNSLILEKVDESDEKPMELLRDK